MSNLQLSIDKFKSVARKLTAISSAIALSILMWSGSVIVTGTPAAQAETIKNPSFVFATSGVKDRVEGAVDKGVGSVQRATGDMTDDPSQEAKGAFKQLKGDAKQNLGSAKGKLDSAGDKIEDKSENLLDSVKDFFSQD